MKYSSLSFSEIFFLLLASSCCFFFFLVISRYRSSLCFIISVDAVAILFAMKRFNGIRRIAKPNPAINAKLKNQNKNFEEIEVRFPKKGIVESYFIWKEEKIHRSFLPCFLTRLGDREDRDRERSEAEETKPRGTKDRS